MFTSGYVNTETILHIFYKITNERGTKTVFTYAHMKRVLWPVRVHVLFELFYKYTVSEERVQKVLANLNQSKASGPDNVPNWLLKECSDILAFPITQIVDASYREQRLPAIWKMADVPPLPKK